ncbi:hypothetical protein NIES4106_58440 (plasmid) [Fischerella sp. NIES-4106]|nr:hypothetical protein NIES4106_58440 [Fischerella sp. NIES-4106]
MHIAYVVKIKSALDKRGARNQKNHPQFIMLTLEEQTNSSTSLSFSQTSLDNDIALASGLWEQANDLLIQAGRLLANAKACSKRNFTKLLSAAHLEKAQVNKLIKAASVADEIPTVVAQRLGFHQILQLAQPKNAQALFVVTPDDTQISIASKIKSYSPTTTPRSNEQMKFVGKKTQKLRIEIPGSHEANNLFDEWKASGLSPLQWLQTRNQPTYHSLNLKKLGVDAERLPQVPLKTQIAHESTRGEVFSAVPGTEQGSPNFLKRSNPDQSLNPDQRLNPLLQQTTLAHNSEQTIEQHQLKTHIESQQQAIVPTTCSPQEEVIEINEEALCSEQGEEERKLLKGSMGMDFPLCPPPSAPMHGSVMGDR